MNSRNTTKIKLIYLPSSMVYSLLQAYHTDPLGGHFGIQRTYLKLKNKFWWPNMIQSVVQYIKSCLPCQQHNVGRTKKPGRLCPIDTPEGPFQMIGIDFCGPFKRTPRDNQYVLCITDYFTRWVNAIALPDCSAQTTAQAIFNEYICRYGVPLSILSDQGTHFRNQLMDSMAKLIGYNHIFSTVYHPQSNGMVERFNATFVPQLAKLHDRESNNWDEYLSPVVFAYNTGIHSTTEYSPYQLQFGREPHLPTDKPPSTYIFHRPIDYYNQLKRSVQIIHQSARDYIIRRQSKYKNTYDKNRHDPHYEINDQVLIKIHGSRSKLDPRYSINPKLIIRKQHPVYWVQDETTQKIHRVHANDIRPILVS
jgi:transposase InsO family protein